MSSDLVTIDINNGIADVRLNREEKYNALSQDMFDAIIDAGLSLASADDVSAVVLSGNGRGFCAGLDTEYPVTARYCIYIRPDTEYIYYLLIY